MQSSWCKLLSLWLVIWMKRKKKMSSNFSERCFPYTLSCNISREKRRNQVISETCLLIALNRFCPEGFSKSLNSQVRWREIPTDLSSHWLSRCGPHFWNSIRPVVWSSYSLQHRRHCCPTSITVTSTAKCCLLCSLENEATECWTRAFIDPT